MISVIGVDHLYFTTHITEKYVLGWSQPGPPLLFPSGENRERPRANRQPGIPWLLCHWKNSPWDSPRPRWTFSFCLMVDLFTTFLYRGHPRDDAIREENLQPGSEKNFHKKGTDLYSARDIAFDFDSVMMYGPTDFGILDSAGKRKTTIQPLVPGVEIRSFCHKIVTDSLQSKIGLMNYLKLLRGPETKTDLSFVDL